MILHGSVFSKVLDMDTGITVLAPNNPSARGYRVAYVLHGLCGNHATWTDYTMLPYFAGEGSTIYVMPEAGRSFYTDMVHGLDYFTYLVDELPVICKSMFHISAKREDTAIIGGSMGGYGALKAALSRPGQYGMCAAFSSCCLFLKEGLDDQRENGMNPDFIAKFGEKLPKDFVSIFGEGLAWKPEYEILDLARKAASSEFRPTLYLACGTEDPFHSDHLRFQTEIKKLALDVTYEEWPGAHDFPFFNTALEKAIRYFQL